LVSRSAPTRRHNDGVDGYDHVQRTWYAPLFAGVAAVLLGCAALLRPPPGAVVALVAAGVALGLAAGAMAWLRVRDAGDRLEVRFGPLPLFRRRLWYRDVERAELSRSHWYEGWGVRWNPVRGWLWNAAGLDCVCVYRAGRRKPFRIGTDDPHGLAAFLNARAGAPG
jgi:hypothetical protein